MIYPQTSIAPESVLAIIPPGIVPAFFSVQAKGIIESPLSNLFQRRSLALAEEHMPFPLRRVMHISLFGRDVKIPAEQNSLVLFVTLIKESAQALHPFKLETILIRAYELPIRNI